MFFGNLGLFLLKTVPKIQELTLESGFYQE